VQAQIQQLDAMLAAVVGAWGGEKGMALFQEFRADLAALLEGAAPADAPAEAEEWDGRCEFVMQTKN
jgi:hypothetical protein